MYLSEVTNFLGHPVFLKSKIRKNFFKVKTDTRTTDFQFNAKILANFRNCIAHIDERKFKKDFKRFSSGLEYFERILGFNDVLTISALKAINPSHRLSTLEILKIIYNTDKKIFDNDKILIPLFDEIALFNGYSYDVLPQRWTIIRLKYKIESEDKKNSENYDINQLNLFSI